MSNYPFSAEDRALMSAVRENPGDAVCRLVYADWLEERDANRAATFLRRWASLPPLLRDGDTAAEREQLARHLAARAELRELRNRLDAAWLSSVGDTGLVGEVVVTELLATACTVTFGIIIKETPKTVTVARLPSRLVHGDSQDGLVRPVLPGEGEWVALRAAGGNSARKQPDGAKFTNDRQFERWRFWEGKDHAHYGD